MPPTCIPARENMQLLVHSCSRVASLMLFSHHFPFTFISVLALIPAASSSTDGLHLPFRSAQILQLPPLDLFPPTATLFLKILIPTIPCFILYSQVNLWWEKGSKKTPQNPQHLWLHYYSYLSTNCWDVYLAQCLTQHVTIIFEWRLLGTGDSDIHQNLLMKEGKWGLDKKVGNATGNSRR